MHLWVGNGRRRQDIRREHPLKLSYQNILRQNIEIAYCFLVRFQSPSVFSRGWKCKFSWATNLDMSTNKIRDLDFPSEKVRFFIFKPFLQCNENLDVKEVNWHQIRVQRPHRHKGGFYLVGLCYNYQSLLFQNYLATVNINKKLLMTKYFYISHKPQTQLHSN